MEYKIASHFDVYILVREMDNTQAKKSRIQCQIAKGSMKNNEEQGDRRAGCTTLDRIILTEGLSK